MNPYSVYATCVTPNHYQVFVRNISHEAEFIRLIIGYTEMKNGERVGKVQNSWIVSPLTPQDEPVFVQAIYKQHMSSRRLWVAFEAVKRSKPRNTTISSFFALSPVASKWRSTIGSPTYFEIIQFESIRSIENSPALARMSGTIR